MSSIVAEREARRIIVLPDSGYIRIFVYMSATDVGWVQEILDMNTRSRSANRRAAEQRERNRQQDRDRRARARQQESDQQRSAHKF